MLLGLQRNTLYLGGCSAKLYILHQNLRTKGTSLGCWLAPEMISIAKNCILCAHNKHPTQNTAFGWSFLGHVKPLYRKLEISHGCALGHTDSRLLFQTFRNSCWINVWKAVLYWWQKEAHFGAVWQNLRGDFPENFYVTANCDPTLKVQVSSKSVQVWKVITEKSFRDTQSDFNIGLFEPILIITLTGVYVHLVLWCCWMGARKAIRPVKKLSGGVLARLSVWSEVRK